MKRFKPKKRNVKPKALSTILREQFQHPLMRMAWQYELRVGRR